MKMLQTRLSVAQVLYSKIFISTEVDTFLLRFQKIDYTADAHSYVSDFADGVSKNWVAMQKHVALPSTWRWDRLDFVLQILFVMAMYEIHVRQVPVAICISEYLKLCDLLGVLEGKKLLHFVLDSARLDSSSTL